MAIDQAIIGKTICNYSFLSLQLAGNSESIHLFGEDEFGYHNSLQSALIPLS